MKRISLIIALMGTTSATAAFGQANEVFFQQTDRAGGATVGVGTLTIEQSGSAGNRIGSSAVPSFLKGGAGSLTIRQLNASTAANTTEISIESRDVATESYDFEFLIDGSGNNQKFTLGSPGIASTISSTFVSMMTLGNENMIKANLAAVNGESSPLVFYVISDGDRNTFDATSQNGLEAITSYSEIRGDDNKVTFAYGSSAGLRSTNLNVYGNNNDWTLNNQSTDTLMTIEQVDTGSADNVTGVINQINAPHASTYFQLSKFGAGAFLVGVQQGAASANASVSLTALNGGSFSLTQASAGSNYTATHTIAAGGTATINQ